MKSGIDISFFLQILVFHQVNYLVQVNLSPYFLLKFLIPEPFM